MSNSVLFYVGLGVIVLIFIWVTFSSKKKRWYKVYLANNDVLLLCRDLSERWWRSNGSYLRFKDELGNEVTFPLIGHNWILKMVSVKDTELDIARAEVKRIAENQAKGQ